MKVYYILRCDFFFDRLMLNQKILHLLGLVRVKILTRQLSLPHSLLLADCLLSAENASAQLITQQRRVFLLRKNRRAVESSAFLKGGKGYCLWGASSSLSLCSSAQATSSPSSSSSEPTATTGNTVLRIKKKKPLLPPESKCQPLRLSKSLHDFHIFLNANDLSS